MRKWLPLRDYDHLHVLCETDNSVNQIPAKNREPLSVVGTREKDLRDLVSPGKINKCPRHVLSIQDSSLEVQIARKIQMALNCFSIGRRQSSQVACGLHRDRETFRLQKITYTFCATNQHRGFRISGY